MIGYPIIKHIDDVRPFLEGREEFGCYEKSEGFTVIQYQVAFEDTFPPVTDYGSAVLREFRGIKFCSVTGKILARPYHKFFNIGERDESLPGEIDITKPHVVMDKLDGSMVHPIRTHDGWLHWCTKMGVTDTSKAAVNTAMTPAHMDFANAAIDAGYTPIFEFVSPDPKHRIVLEYDRPQLILTGIRHMTDGVYTPINSLIFKVASSAGIPVVKTFDPSNDLNDTINHVRSTEGTEGIVMAFGSGEMYKVKSEEYVRVHRVKATVYCPHLLTQCVMNNELDDIMPILRDVDIEYVRGFSVRLHELIQRVADVSVNILTDCRKLKLTRKEFATSPGLSHQHKAPVFKLWDSTNPVGDAIVNARTEVLSKAEKMLKWETFCAGINLDPHLNLIGE